MIRRARAVRCGSVLLRRLRKWGELYGECREVSRKKRLATNGSKPPQAITEYAAWFDAAIVFIQRNLVICQPLVALRLPDIRAEIVCQS